MKTRLAAALTASEASELYLAFLRDASRLYASRRDWRLVLCADPDGDDPRLSALFPEPLERRPQGPGDLGDRLRRAFAEAFAAGAPAAVAVGADHPSLPIRSLEDSVAALETDDAAIVPAEDGGYCAIGLAARRGAAAAAVFRGVPWSTREVLARTLDRMAEERVSCRVLESFYDVDRPEDLERLRRDLESRDPSGEDYPAETAACLAALHRGRGARVEDAS